VALFRPDALSISTKCLARFAKRFDFWVSRFVGSSAPQDSLFPKTVGKSEKLLGHSGLVGAFPFGNFSLREHGKNDKEHTINNNNKRRN